MNQPAKTVVVAGGLLAALTLAEYARRPQSFAKGGVYKRVWAIGVITLALAIGSDFAPELTVPFAVLLVVAFAVRYKGAFGAVIGGQAKPAAPVQPVR